MGIGKKKIQPERPAGKGESSSSETAARKTLAMRARKTMWMFRKTMREF